ncbi:hypothetical protein IMZ48_20095 [Candidatus Bathyarchaeota archaeon]|nr:hypothetical protein [Candidatus Bathyarchaeota archaeon]
MSRRTFAETVVNLAVESCLVCHVNGILTPSKVNAMEDAEVRELSSESPEVTYERELLESQVAKLRDGLKICRRHRPRGTQGPFAAARLPLLVRAELTGK